MTLTKTLLAVASVFLLVSCGGGSVTVPSGPVRLAEMRADSRPYYWVGESFNGLELTYAEPYNGRFGNVGYGTCEAPTGLFAESACALPLQVQNVLCADGSATVALFSDGGGRSARGEGAAPTERGGKARRRAPRHVRPQRPLLTAHIRDGV
jgi:hypothetical protein